MHYQEEHKCPVKGMVDINDGYIPDDGENWDNVSILVFVILF